MNLRFILIDVALIVLSQCLIKYDNWRFIINTGDEDRRIQIWQNYFQQENVFTLDPEREFNQEVKNI